MKKNFLKRIQMERKKSIKDSTPGFVRTQMTFDMPNNECFSQRAESGNLRTAKINVCLIF